MNLRKPLILSVWVFVALVSCRGVADKAGSWRTLLSESDRLATMQEWEQATEYALKALSDPFFYVHL